jgi:hypothetical protein
MLPKVKLPTINGIMAIVCLPFFFNNTYAIIHTINITILINKNDYNNSITQ